MNSKKNYTRLYLLVFIAIFVLTSCKSTTPSPAYFQEKVTKIVLESENLSKKGEYFPPDINERKEITEDTLNLILDSAETESRFIGVVGHPEAMHNTQCYLDLAEQLISSPTNIKNLEYENGCTNSDEVINDVKKIWDDGKFAAIPILVLFSPIWVVSITLTGLADLAADWRQTIGEERSFALDPLIIHRHADLSSKLKNGTEIVRYNQNAPQLNIVMSYTLEGDEDSISEWKALKQRGELPGDKSVDGWFFDEMIPGFYQKEWMEFQKELRPILKKSNGHFIGTPMNISLLQPEEGKLIVLARIGVWVPERIADFRVEIQELSKQEEGILFTVELHPNEVDIEEKLLKQGLESELGPFQK